MSSDVTGGRFIGIRAEGASPGTELMPDAVRMDDEVSSIDG